MNEIYTFQFSALINPPSRNMVYTVYSDKQKDIEMFLKQHNMNDGLEYIITTTEDEADVDDIQMIKPYKFGSNRYRDKIYTIYSTYQLVELAIRDTVNEMSLACEFNDIIIRNELPLIKHVKEMIDKTTFGYALDVESSFSKKCDEYQDTKYHISNDKRKWEFGGYYPGEQYAYSEDEEDPDSNELGDALLGIFEACDLMPITMEAYIESFVATITDKYE